MRNCIQIFLEVSVRAREEICRQTLLGINMRKIGYSIERDETVYEFMFPAKNKGLL